MKRLDSELEYLAPGNFVVDCMFDLMRGKNVPFGSVIAGVPKRVDAEEYAHSFAKRFISSTREKGKLPPGYELVSLEQEVGYRTFLRALVELKIHGARPLHEVFPVLVNLADGELVPASLFAARTTYDPKDHPAIARALPKEIDRVRLSSALDSITHAVDQIGSSLMAEAIGPNTQAVEAQRIETERYYDRQLLLAPFDRDAIEAERATRLESLDESRHARAAAMPISLTVIHEVVPHLGVIVANGRGREFEFRIPAIPGRAEIPDDAICCGHLDRPLLIDPAGGIYCDECLQECRCCSTGSANSACEACAKQGHSVCIDCAVSVGDGWSCEKHSFVCSIGGERHLSIERTKCARCDADVCRLEEHSSQCETQGETFCRKCATIHLYACRECGGKVCSSHALRSSVDDAPLCSGCAVECSACKGTMSKSQGIMCSTSTCAEVLCPEDANDHFCTQCGKVTCVDHLGDSTLTNRPFCDSHRVDCRACGTVLGEIESQKCEGCHAPFCEACCVETRAGQMACLGCTGQCAVDGHVHFSNQLKRCTQHDDSSAQFCEDHCSTCKSCAVPICAEHTEIASLSSDTLCSRCIVECSDCGGTLREVETVHCTICDQPHCKAHDSKCSYCLKPVCHTHRVVSVLTGAVVCLTCAVPCQTCEVAIGPDEGVGCGSCSARFCGLCGEVPHCAEGGHPTCVDHLSACKITGQELCESHRESCVRCEATLKEEVAEACSSCGDYSCWEHTARCRLDDKILCDKCAVTTTLDTGIFCDSHLKTCSCCNERSAYFSVGSNLCKLCEIFRTRITAGELPFSIEKIDCFVRSGSGFARKLATIRWSVAENCVLVWVQSGLLKKNKFGVFDLAGNRLPSIVPRPEGVRGLGL